MLGKVSVVSGVGEGFIGNRIYNAYHAQCEAMLLAGGFPDEIDAAIEAFGFPRHLGGPLHWAARQDRGALKRNLVLVADAGRRVDRERLG